jgi:Domain of unknown function (DUF4872)/Butirosin biosynthesis protein H, N-terminal
MTRHKHLKQLVRARMSRTGESYSAARRQVVQQASPESTQAFIHFPGAVPGAAALRTLAANAGVSDPATGRPFTEAMVFGIAGGIGAGVFAFHYEKEDFSSFFIAGRHSWQDEKRYLESGAERLGLGSTVREAGGAKAAQAQLEAALEQGPVVAWVDMANLPYRAMPAMWSGGGYHIAVVYRIADGSALVGDLADQPFTVSLPDLSVARSRIKKDKQRILSVEKTGTVNLKKAVADGLRACHAGLTSARQANFTLKAFGDWADRLDGATSRDSWERVFPPGHRMWQGLRSVHDFIENYGTGGGLMRPLFGEFLHEAGRALKNSRLEALGKRYAAVGELWSELADAALPDKVPGFKRGKSLLTRKAELLTSGGSPEEIREVWDELGAITDKMKGGFPLTAQDARRLRQDLQVRVRQIHQEETLAHEELGSVTSSL